MGRQSSRAAGEAQCGHLLPSPFPPHHRRTTPSAAAPPLTSRRSRARATRRRASSRLQALPSSVPTSPTPSLPSSHRRSRRWQWRRGGRAACRRALPLPRRWPGHTLPFPRRESNLLTPPFSTENPGIIERYSVDSSTVRNPTLHNAVLALCQPVPCTPRARVFTAPNNVAGLVASCHHVYTATSTGGRCDCRRGISLRG